MIKEFNPDLMIISAGFDSARGDPLGQIGVSPIGYAYMTWGLRNLCQKTAVILEGGYDLDALARSSEAVVRTLLVNPGDKESFNGLLVELSANEATEVDEYEAIPDLTLESLVANSLDDVRESFR